MSNVERFMKYVSPEPNCGCWLWTGFSDKDGYGKFWINERKMSVAAHRVSYELYASKIPDGHVIDHMCRVRSCVNPDHLRVVTQLINVRENNSSPCSLNARKTHCKHGHELTEENVCLVRDGRACKVCIKLRMRIYRARKKL